MHIIVCIKQVPDSSEVQTDPKTGNLIRDSAKTKMNPYDLYPLEEALKLKESRGATVSVISMGPLQALSTLQEAYALGADHAYLLSDRAFAGADVLATSYTLALGIESLAPYDLILCGKQTTDGDTAQVGASIAQWLNLPSVCYVNRLEVMSDGFLVEADYDQFVQEVKLKAPALLTIDKEANTPRLPSYLLKKKNADKKIEILTLDDLLKIKTNRLKDEQNYFGSTGSATQVERMFQPVEEKANLVFKDQGKELAKVAFQALRDRNLL